MNPSNPTVTVEGKEYNILTAEELSAYDSNEYRIIGVYRKSWNCDNQTGYHTVKVHTPGVHNQRFMFGGMNATAHNFAMNQTDVTDWDKGNYTNTTSNSSGVMVVLGGGA